MNLRENLNRGFKFNIYHWAVVFISSLIAIEGFTIDQFPSIVYYLTLWVSLPLQILFVYWFFNRTKTSNSDAFLIFIAFFLVVHLSTNPYLNTPFTLFWSLFFILNVILGPIVVVWSGLILFRRKVPEV